MSRSRTRANPIPPLMRMTGNWGETEINPFSLTPSYWTPLEAPGMAEYSYMVDEVTPTGHDRTFNQVSHDRRSAANCTEGGGEIIYPESIGLTIECSMQHAFCSYPIVTADYPSPNWSSMLDTLCSKLNGSINQGHLLAVTLAETEKTVAMIKNPFNLLKADWRKIARTLSAAQLAKAGSNLWLEHRYGWNALWQDVKSFSKTMAPAARLLSSSFSEEGLDRISIKDGHSLSSGDWVYDSSITQSQWRDIQTFSNWLTKSVGKGGWMRRRRQSGFVTHRLGCVQDIDLHRRWSRTQRLLQGFGLDATSIATVLWELVPYSFVVDWFIDTQGLWALPYNAQRLQEIDVRNLGSSHSFREVSEIELIVSYNSVKAYHWSLNYYTPISYTGSPWYYRSASPAVAKYFQRIPGGPGIPAVAASAFNAGLSSIQSISGLSLLFQRLFA